MKRFVTSIFAAALFTSCLKAQINPPRAGFLRYGSLPLQGVYGIPGNFVPAQASFGAATAVSFSDAGGLLAANGLIELVRADGSLAASYKSGPTTPLLNIDRDLTTAVAWLPDSHSLVWWNGKRFELAELGEGIPNGRITSVALTSPTTARLLVTNPDGSVSAAVVSLATDNISSSDLLPEVTGPAFQFGSFLLWAGESGLELQAEAGLNHTLTSPAGPFTAERMSTHWVHVYFPSDRTHWALHLSETQPTLWRLPALSPDAVKENR